MEIDEIINGYDEAMDNLRIVTADLRNAKNFSLTPNELCTIQKKYNVLMAGLSGVISILKDARNRDKKHQDDLKKLQALDELEEKIYEIEKAQELPF